MKHSTLRNILWYWMPPLIITAALIITSILFIRTVAADIQSEFTQETKSTLAEIIEETTQPTEIETTEAIDISEEASEPEEPIVAIGIVPTEPSKRSIDIPKETSAAEMVHSDSDVEILAKIICQEAGAESEQMKLMVGNVVRNRVESHLFPNSYHGVATQKYQYGYMWRDGVHWMPYSSESQRAECMEIAQRIISGETVLPANVVFQAGFVQGSGIHTEMNGVYFCYA